MQESDRGLLARIEQDLVDGTLSTAAILQKCIILGARTGSEDLSNWAQQELRGYADEDDVPAYRKIRAQICIDGQSGLNLIRGQGIDETRLPTAVREAGFGNEVPLPFPLGELEAFAKDPEGSIRIPLPGDSMIARLMTAELGGGVQSIHTVYWLVMRATLQGVVEQIRTALAVLIAELVRSMPAGGETPTASAADHAVHAAISGGGSHNTVNVFQASSGGTNTSGVAPGSGGTSWWSRWRNRGIVVGIATVLAAVAGVGTWLGWIPFGATPEPALTPAVEAPR